MTKKLEGKLAPDGVLLKSHQTIVEGVLTSGDEVKFTSSTRRLSWLQRLMAWLGRRVM